MSSVMPPYVGGPGEVAGATVSRQQHKGKLLPSAQQSQIFEEKPPAVRLAIKNAIAVASKLHPLKVAVIGSYAPRKCGIATFTEDVVTALRAYCPDMTVEIWPVRTAQELADGLTDNAMVEGDPESFRAAAHAIAKAGVDIVVLQHEFGLFGGSAGDAVLALVDALPMPLITTLHTILENPDVEQRRVMSRLAAKSARLMVMTGYSSKLLESVYGVDPRRISLIEHGVPDRPSGMSAHYKDKLGFTGPTLLTFGLLSPGKGIETAIAALPAIIAEHPEVIYCIAGATHPNLVAHEGEAYRQRLQALSRQLGVEQHIHWVNKFLDLDDLLDLIDAADIYVTPYPGAAQSTSGTLSYAVALGKAVISTPYIHAKDLLSDGTGVLVPFNDSIAISDAVCDLLDHPRRLAAMQERAYARGRSMTWNNYAANCLNLFNEACIEHRPMPPFDPASLPLDGFLAMCDDTGMFQHGRFAIADRNHGYCIDDNVRALMLVNRVGPEAGPQTRLASTLAAFINHAWNDDSGSFRNFMDYSRQWLERAGSEDSNGRTIWALGMTASEAADERIAHWAADLYERSAGVTRHLHSPRTIAFSILGAVAYLGVNPRHRLSEEIVEQGLSRLGDLLARVKRDNWCWFESGLSYDNARLCEAMLRGGKLLGNMRAMADGIETLKWLSRIQTSEQGRFRPVGTDGFHAQFEAPLPFDQQPLEAWAMIDACAAAFDVDGDLDWVNLARIAYGWYDGANDRSLVMGDPEYGRCYDGLSAQGRNLNSGAESILAYQLAHISMRALLTRSDTL